MIDKEIILKYIDGISANTRLQISLPSVPEALP